MNIQREQMQCMEIVGGNLATDRVIGTPGLDVYINSSPHLASKVGGGDVYYLTSCASGRITRLLLADVSGHGAPVANLANSLRDSLRQNVNTISQSRFVRDMNQEFQRVNSDEHMATAVVATYFEPTHRLALALAGHPNPLIFRHSDQRWHKVEEQPVKESEEFRNMPLGVVGDSIYPTRNLQVETGDMVLLYSDAFIESLSLNGQYLGIQGVLDLLNQQDSSDPAQIIPRFRTTIQSWQTNNLTDDDATIILGHFNGSKPKLGKTLSAPFRLFSKVSDKTEVRC